MPVPRRQLHRLATDANGVVPTYHDSQPAKPATIKRCGRCDCRLANDQTDHFCSPCQSVMGGATQLVHDYLDYKPYR